MLVKHCWETFIFLFSQCGRADSTAHFMDQLSWMVRENIYLLSFCKLCWSGKGLLHRDNPSNPCHMTCFSLFLFPLFFLPKYFLFRSIIIVSQIPSSSCSLFSHCPWACWLHTLLHIFGMTVLVMSLLAISSAKLVPIFSYLVSPFLQVLSS